MKPRRPIVAVIAAMAMTALTSSTTVLFIGDSITDGNWGNPSGYPCPTERRSLTDMNHIYGHGYVYTIASSIESEYPDTARRFINRGISGNTLADLEARWQSDVIANRPDMVSVLVGTNDVHYWLDGDRTVPFDFDGWECRYRALLDLTRDSLPGVEIVLGTPFTARVGYVGRRGDFDTRKAMIGRLDSITMKIATDYGAVLVPYDRMFERLLADTSLPDTYWIWDGIHPTPAGHKRMADLWLDNVERADSRVLRLHHPADTVIAASMLESSIWILDSAKVESGFIFDDGALTKFMTPGGSGPVKVTMPFYLSATADTIFSSVKAGASREGRYIVVQEPRGKVRNYEILELTGSRLRLHIVRRPGEIFIDPPRDLQLSFTRQSN